MKIVFLRHGQDDDTCRGGWSACGLLDEGHAQAQKVARYLAEQPGFAIGAIYASDLTRTMETAAHCSQVLNLPIREAPELREIDNGCLAGMPNGEALAKYPGLFFRSLEMEESYPEGESPAVFYCRVKAWFRKFLEEKRDSGTDALVVTHGGVIQIVYHLVKGLPWTNKATPVSAAKCSIHVLNVDTMSFEVENLIVW